MMEKTNELTRVCHCQMFYHTLLVINPLSPHNALMHNYYIPENTLNFPTTRGFNLRLVVHEDENGKPRLERVIAETSYNSY